MSLNIAPVYVFVFMSISILEEFEMKCANVSG